jgi:hypothetical protein
VGRRQQLLKGRRSLVPGVSTADVIERDKAFGVSQMEVIQGLEVLTFGPMELWELVQGKRNG